MKLSRIFSIAVINWDMFSEPNHVMLSLSSRVDMKLSSFFHCFAPHYGLSRYHGQHTLCVAYILFLLNNKLML